MNNLAKFFFGSSILLLVIFYFTDCTNKQIVNPNQPAVSFKDEVQPILIGNCTTSGCHGASTGNGESFPLMTYNDVINYGGISAGKPEKSGLYKSIIGKAESPMPPNGPMPDAQISIIYNWIAQGAKNN
ncbi:MAG: hypothetical protein WCI97_04795 [Bacteroidota bacterium]|jgi:hypothetical protein